MLPWYNDKRVCIDAVFIFTEAIMLLFKRNFIIWLSAAVLILSSLFAIVDNTSSQQAQDERTVLQTELQKELQGIENQIAEYEAELKNIKGEKNTLQNKIKQLQKQQTSVNLQIKSTNLQIADLESQLSDIKDSIEKNIAKTEQLRGQMAEVIRLINEYDNYSLLYVLLSKDSLSDALNEMETYSRLSSVLGDLIGEAAQTKEQLIIEQKDLSDKQDAAENLLSIKALQKKELTNSVNEQNTLLKETKGKESNYKAVLSASQKKAAEIRNRLYQLLEVPTQITFGEAVQIAQWVSGQTGVRAAFLLAILTQESNLGRNVGTCNRLNDPPAKNWKAVMKPDRDQAPFLAITSELGLNPDTTPVSCPMKDSRGRQIGWGGAMGPAQFIPSTWMGYRSRVTAITGKPANPWDIRDAFISSATKLKADGAGNVSGEWAAAMKYFSGSTNKRYRFYGDNVVRMANQYQEDINSMSGQ